MKVEKNVKIFLLHVILAREHIPWMKHYTSRASQPNQVGNMTWPVGMSPPLLLANSGAIQWAYKVILAILEAVLEPNNMRSDLPKLN